MLSWIFAEVESKPRMETQLALAWHQAMDGIGRASGSQT
jgi:hypothetical protein